MNARTFLRLLDQQLGVSDAMADRKMSREAYASLSSLVRRGLAEVGSQDGDVPADHSGEILQELRHINGNLREMKDVLRGMGR